MYYRYYQKQFVLIQICDANKHLLLKVQWCVVPLKTIIEVFFLLIGLIFLPAAKRLWTYPCTHGLVALKAIKKTGFESSAQ